MLDSVFEKSVWDSRRSIWWWLGGLVALAAMMVYFYPAVTDMGDFAELLENYPEAMLAMFGIDPQEFATASGFISGELYSAMLPIMFLIFTILRGAAATAGAEEDGTMDLTLSTPVSRTRVVVESFLGMAFLTTVLGASLVIVLLAGNPLADLGLSVEGIFAANIGLVLLGLVFGALALAVGAWTGRRVMAAGVAAGAAVAAFFVNALAALVDELEIPQQASPFHWFLEPKPLTTGFDWPGLLLLASTTLVLFTLAIWGFRRRNIAV